ncbi:hypothetical protein LTR53_011731 [Teratosphaeriaceae sp. CCFEE 6253]|nr:hypothetical protein LTR53_011731 [Teratosphaeriaceae sp. CCFEE 6253]
MVDFKALLHGHKQTEKEGGSSNTHPLAHTTDKHHGEHATHSTEGATGAYPRPADNAFERDTPPSGGLAHHTEDPRHVTERAAYRQAPHGDAHGHDGAHHLGYDTSSAGGAGTTRGANDIAAARQEHAADVMTHTGHEGSGHSATGLETSDGYRAAAQAGALLDKNDISNIDREVAAGGAGAGMGAGHGYDSTSAHGANAGIKNAEGLIHGHHTTNTGENLDPHLSSRQ